MFFLRRKPAFKTIDSEKEDAMFRLHQEHPEMGRQRLHAALLDLGIEVDPQELKHFLRSHDRYASRNTAGDSLLGGTVSASHSLAKVPSLKRRLLAGQLATFQANESSTTRQGCK
jgi:hypothetical protein